MHDEEEILLTTSTQIQAWWHFSNCVICLIEGGGIHNSVIFPSLRQKNEKNMPSVTLQCIVEWTESIYNTRKQNQNITHFPSGCTAHFNASRLDFRRRQWRIPLVEDWVRGSEKNEMEIIITTIQLHSMFTLSNLSHDLPAPYII